WTWTLYEGPGPVVLANERPDTPDLLSTLECNPHTGLVRLSLYQSTAKPGSASVSSGDVVATVEATSADDGAVVAPLRTDHPVFARFTATGNLSVAIGGAHQAIEIPAPDLAKLRRFADLCSG
ncbi:MAG: hypothetical protein JWR59_441, partial [Brevundimonas sp.]|nr:hypothetical protein [Brevundimonas sp.]